MIDLFITLILGLLLCFSFYLIFKLSLQRKKRKEEFNKIIERQELLLKQFDDIYEKTYKKPIKDDKTTHGK